MIRLDANEINRLAAMWRKRIDTMTMSRLTGLRENVIYSHLTHIRARAREIAA